MKYQSQSKDLIEGGPRRATGNTEDTGGRPPLNNEIGSTYRTRLRVCLLRHRRRSRLSCQVGIGF